MVNDDWKLPKPPEGFTTPVAFYGPDEVYLDWTREPQRDFASEFDIESNIDWPFTDGTPHVKDGKPDVNLWQSVGITPLW